MKKSLFTVAMISALVACSVPITSYAADVKLLKAGNGYMVYSIQGNECLQETIKDICENLGNSNIVCPETPEEPEDQVPETPVQPDVQEPETPTQPDVQKPETPEQPDVQEPETPEQPDVQEPETPVEPDVQEPDTETSDENIHFYVTQVLNLVNEERAKAGLSEIKLDMNVTAAANVRAKEIKQSFSHTRPNGDSFSTALIEQGVSFRRSGENIAWGQKTPKQVMDAWMNSEGHRANILNQNYENIGIGYYQDANGVNYWVQLFTA